MGPSSHRVMLQENVGVAMSHSEKQHVTEGEKTTLLKELCKQTTASINAVSITGHISSSKMPIASSSWKGFEKKVNIIHTGYLH